MESQQLPLEQKEQLTSALPMSLSPDDVKRIRNVFEMDGVVGPLDILSPTEASEVLQEVLEWEQSLPSPSDDVPHPIQNYDDDDNDDHSSKRKLKIVGNLRFKPHLFLPKLNHRIVRHPRLVQAVQAALQSTNIFLWSCDLNIKEANTPMYFAPHQDATYTGLSPPDKCLTAWIALTDPVSEREGCLQFWKGSHRIGQAVHEEISHDNDPYNILSRGQRIQDMMPLKSLPLVSIPLRAGQATLHHFHTVHQSGPNHNPNLVRIGLACRYIDATVRHVPRNGMSLESKNHDVYNMNGFHDNVVDDDHQPKEVRECVTWISGQVAHDGFELEPILPELPTAEQVEYGRKAHAIGMEREAANYFQGAQVREYDERGSNATLKS